MINKQKILHVDPARREVKTATAKTTFKPESYAAKYRRVLFSRYLDGGEVR